MLKKAETMKYIDPKENILGNWKTRDINWNITNAFENKALFNLQR